MSRLWPVVRREYLERVRSRAFVIGTVLGPLFMAAVSIGPSLLASRERGKPLRVVVLDATTGLGEPVSAALGEAKANGEPRFEVEPPLPATGAETARTRQRVLEGRLDGYIFLPSDVLETSLAEYRGSNTSNVMDIGLMRETIGQVLILHRLHDAGLDAERVKALSHGLDLKPVRVSAAGEQEDRGFTLITSLVMVMMLYMSVLMWGQALMTGVIEEKSNRVVEVIVSSIRANELLAGKLLGIGAAGLTQLAIWVGTLAFLNSYAIASVGMAGRLPRLPPGVLAAFPLFFLLGFFLYSALYAAIGAAVNSAQEAQGLAFPVVTPLIMSVVLMFPVMQSPGSRLSTVLSLVPFFTPILMFLRITTLTPPAWQIALSIALTVATIAGIIWAAARVYRVGILMYGKRPTFPEILRWVGRA